MAYSRKDLIKVAKLYYEQDKTQSEVAEIIDVTRQTVARMLEAAKKSGIIKITVLDENEQYYSLLADQIREKYNLDDVIIEIAYDNSPESIRHSLGIGGSKYLENKLIDGQTLGCSWGRTLLEVVTELKSSNKRVDVVQLNGFVGQIYNKFNSSELARNIANKFKGDYYHLPAPGIIESTRIKELLLQEKSIKNPLDKARKADIAAVGIGSLENSLLYQFGLFKDKDIKKLKEKNVVGDICLHLINDKGEEINSEWNNKIVGIDLDSLKNIDCVIGIAGGKNKAKAILAALQGEIIDVLITDSYTAELIK